MSGDLPNVMLHATARWQASRYSERHGLVTSYDPLKYLCKVTLMPEGQETGWIPIETGHIGNGYGTAVGLTTGSGKGGGEDSSGEGSGGGSGGGSSGSSGGNDMGDQVIVRFQEGDIESGKVVQRVHSDQDTPPKTESGEMNTWTSGKKMTFSDNKGKDAIFELDGKSNYNVNCKTHTTTTTKDVVVTSV